MKKRNKTFGHPTVPDQKGLPEQLRGVPKTAKLLLNASADDFLWLGEDGDFDLDNFLRASFSPEALLKTVLEAVVAAYPQSSPSAATRMAAAMEALVGADRGGPGRQEEPKYDDALMAMSRAYLLGFVGLEDPQQSMNALCLWALRQDPKFTTWRLEEVDHRKRVLRRRFEKGKDVLLARLSMASLPEVQAARRRVNAAIVTIRNLGIPMATFGLNGSNHGD